MKKPLLILLNTLVFSSVFAQRVDLDRFNFTASYRDFPNEPLPAEYKTYNIRIEASPSLGLGYSASNLENMISIEALKEYVISVAKKDIRTSIPCLSFET